MPENTPPSFGDNVRIRSTPETERLNLAGRQGTVSGFTTPSVTGVEAIGSPLEDYALAVMFEDAPVQVAWFASDLVEFVDHAPGTEIRVGNINAVRNADGTWNETTIDGARIELRSQPREETRKRWWQFWSRG